MKPITYGRQKITDDDIQEVLETLSSDYLTQGPKIDAFEKDFASYVEAKYAVAVANGTAALHLSCLVAGINSNDIVITSPITFAASANCVVYCGGRVKFADIDKSTYLIDLNVVENYLKKDRNHRIKGIIPVDFAGNPVNVQELKYLADKYNIWIIEDACHAPGSYFIDSFGNKVLCGDGRYSDMTIFSFHPVKHITTGEGGMITTNDFKKYDKLNRLRSHGITKMVDQLHESHGGWYYEMQDLGYNYRLTDIQASLGISQLKRADEGIRKRHELVKRYNQAFQNERIIFQGIPKNFFHSYHLYIIQINERLALYNYLKENKIYSQVHYIPVHLMPYYKNLGCKKGDCPVAEEYYEKCLSLPLYPSLSFSEQDFVIKTVKEFLAKHE